MTLSIFTVLCKHLQYLIPQYFRHPKRNSLPISSHSQFPLSSNPWQTSNLLSVSEDLSIPEISYK